MNTNPENSFLIPPIETNTLYATAAAEHARVAAELAIAIQREEELFQRYSNTQSPAIGPVMADAFALLAGEELGSVPSRETVGSDLALARRKVSALRVAMNISTDRLRRAQQCATYGLVGELKPELDERASRIRDSVLVILDETKALWDIKRAAVAAGYEEPTTAKTFCVGGLGEFDTFEAINAWLRDTWRSEWLKRRQGDTDPNLTRHMEREAAEQRRRQEPFERVYGTTWR
jgi:hypothetical protein